MDDTVHGIALQQSAHGLEVADVSLDKGIVRHPFYVLEVCQIPGVSKLVQIYDMIVRIFVYEKPDHMASYESGTAGHDDIAFVFHFSNHLSSSIHFFKESFQYGMPIPKVFFTRVLSRTEK